MIKAHVTLTGAIAGNIQKRSNNDGSTYVAFPVNVAVKNKNGEKATLSIFVNIENSTFDETRLTNGMRITLEGDVDISSKDKILKFYMIASDVKEYDSTDGDTISGTVTFRGKLGNRIEERKSKKGEPFISTSGFSTEKIAENNFEFTWTNLLWFNHSKESWMQPKTKVDATGTLRIEPFRNAVTLSCNVTTMAVTVEPVTKEDNNQPSTDMPFQPQSSTEEQPF